MGLTGVSGSASFLVCPTLILETAETIRMAEQGILMASATKGVIRGVIGRVNGLDSKDYCNGALHDIGSQSVMDQVLAHRFSYTIQSLQFLIDLNPS